MRNKAHRTCHVCGRQWNVSRLEPGEKHYTCPGCNAKRPAQGAEAHPSGKGKSTNASVTRKEQDVK